MLPYRCVSPQCAMPLCQSYTRFDACPVSCLRCMSPCSTPVLLLSLLSPGSRPVSAGSLCCKLVLALPDFKPTQATAARPGLRQPGDGRRSRRGRPGGDTARNRPLPCVPVRVQQAQAATGNQGENELVSGSLEMLTRVQRAGDQKDLKSTCRIRLEESGSGERL